VFFRRSALIAFRIILIAHLLGLAFGMGGASTIDAILLIAARREKVTRELVEVIHVAAGLRAYPETRNGRKNLPLLCGI